MTTDPGTIRIDMSPKEFEKMMERIRRKAQIRALRNAARTMPTNFPLGDSPTQWLSRQASYMEGDDED